MMHAKSFPDREERRILPVGEQHLRPLRFAHSVREREISVNRPISSPLIANSTACRHHTDPRSANCKRGIHQQTASSPQAGFMESVV
jgi:hypothetical protein